MCDCHMFESLEKVEYNRQHEYMTESREKKMLPIFLN